MKGALIKINGLGGSSNKKVFNSIFFIIKKVQGYKILRKRYISPKKIMKFNPLIYKGKYEAIIVNTDSEMVKKIRNMGYQGKIIYEIQGLGSFETAETFLRHVKPTKHVRIAFYTYKHHI
ncbi:hypothetical protein [Alteribacillus bidgolensis]|uniref:hypothetical protein n=1 Tax=Alteribacillus bidgolensis TaxID=930129 RepID=UPI000B89101B|nr:hypothetical protein [Alteribacillus bidgolensis]